MARQRSHLTRPASGTRTDGGLGGRQPRGGVITGYVFKLIRESLGLTQEALAERLGLDKNTIQGWESGRRSLASTRVGDLLRLRHQLCVLGTDGRLLDAMDTAMEADYLLAHALAVEPEDVQPEAHPLAAMVNTGMLVDMLTWPFTEQPPAPLRDAAHAPRRGPVAVAPSLTASEKDRFFRHLRAAAERSTAGPTTSQVGGVLLRRQVYYLPGRARPAPRRGGVVERHGAGRPAPAQPPRRLVAGLGRSAVARRGPVAAG